ncbi:hypothetical protein ACQY0O_003651 [Thecaphora frezii]
MKFLSTVLVALTAAAGVLSQENSANNATAFATGLLAALRENNLTRLASAVEGNAAALVPVLASSGNKTVLAPSNQALQALGDVDNSTLIATIAYHVLNGTYPVDRISAENHTIAATALNNSEYVTLPNNRSQVVVLGKAAGNNTAFVHLASGNVSFANATNGPTYQSILVQPIEQVLKIPGNTSTVAGQLGAQQLAQLLQSANLVSALDRSIVTVFAPNDAAFQAAQQTIQGATPEQQTAVLLNHVINGTTVYSTSLTSSPNVTSASGNTLRLIANSTGAYVQSENITARIVGTDYVAKNGVIHVIDRVLVNTTNNAQAAASAYSSATAAAATQTSVPGVGTQGNEAKGSGSNANENAAGSLKVSGAAAAALAIVVSGMWLIA